MPARDLSSRAGQAARRARALVASRRTGPTGGGPAAALERLASALSSAVTVDDVAHAGASAGAEVTGAAIVAIGTLDRVRATVTLRAEVGLDDELRARWSSVPITRAAPVADVARTGRPVLHPDIGALLARHPHLRDHRRDPRYASLAGFPLRAAGVVTGVIVFAFEEHHDLDGDERSLLASAADLCGVALERARLYEEALEAEQRAQRSAALLSAVAEGMGHYLCVVDNDGRVVLANQALADAFGRERAADLVGVLDSELFSAVDVARRRTAAAQALRSGHPVTVELGEERPEGSGYFLASVTALLGPDGSCQGSITVSSDISQRKELERALATQADELAALLREQRRRRFRAERLARLAATLADAERPSDVARTMHQMGARVLEASACAIVLRAGDDPSSAVVLGHEDGDADAPVEGLARTHRIAVAPRGPFAEVLRTGRALFLSADSLQDKDSGLDSAMDSGADGGTGSGADGPAPQHLGALSHLTSEAEDGGRAGVRWAVLPLDMTGATEGCLALRFDGAPTFSHEHRIAMTGVAAVCGQALWRTRRYEVEHEVAVTLQRTMLETRIPQRPGIAVAVRYLPAVQGIEVGGDWYDVIGLADGRVAVVVGDVVGRGIRAAAVMGQLRTATRALSFLGGPADVLAHLDPLAEEIEDAFLATVACLVLDPESGTVQYSLAGHPPPLVRNADGRVTRLDAIAAPPLGLGAAGGRKDSVHLLQPGSAVLLYTDGLIERRDRDLDTMLERLGTVLSTASATDPEAVCDAVLDDLLGGYRQSDDIAVLCLTFAGHGAAEMHRSFPAHGAELAGARAALRSWLAGHGLDRSTVDEVLLAAGEATANAVEHAGATEVSLVGRIDAGGELVLIVRDDGRWRPPVSTPTRGRGLPLMRALMDEVVVDTTPSGAGEPMGTDGTIVTLRRRLGRPTPRPD